MKNWLLFHLSLMPLMSFADHRFSDEINCLRDLQERSIIEGRLILPMHGTRGLYVVNEGTGEVLACNYTDVIRESLRTPQTAPDGPSPESFILLKIRTNTSEPPTYREVMPPFYTSSHHARPMPSSGPRIHRPPRGVECRVHLPDDAFQRSVLHRLRSKIEGITNLQGLSRSGNCGRLNDSPFPTSPFNRELVALGRQYQELFDGNSSNDTRAPSVVNP